MTNGFVRSALGLLLILIEILLNIVYTVTNCVFFVLKFVIQQLFDVNMIETSKKRKRNSNAQPNQTIAIRGLIDANWQKLLSNNMIMDKKLEKSVEEDKKEHFTGTFRRARMKKTKAEVLNPVQNELKSLNLAPRSDALADSKFEESNSVVKNNTKNKLTKFIAIDCEMVGVGFDGNDHMLARVSLVNKFGDCVYDKFVKAREEVKDYRTDVSGIRKEDLINGEDFVTVQKEVSEIIRGRILVGHSLKNDLGVLFLSHPKRNIRDTSRYKPFRKITKGSTPSLKRLAKEILGIEIQHGEHSSVEDARAAMQLYRTVSKKWEAGMSEKRGYSKIADE